MTLELIIEGAEKFDIQERRVARGALVPRAVECVASKSESALPWPCAGVDQARTSARRRDSVQNVPAAAAVLPHPHRQFIDVAADDPALV